MIVSGRGRAWMSKNRGNLRVPRKLPSCCLESRFHQDMRYKLMVYLYNYRPTVGSIILRVGHNWTL
jgi:hypothetical protein